MDATNTFDKTAAIQRLCQLWPSLTDGQAQLLARRITLRTYEKNDTIYYENDEPECLFFLLSGKVKIYKEGVGGRLQIVRMAKPGGFFGYRAGFAGETYSTSGSAFEPSELCLIPVDVILDIIQTNNGVAVYFLRQLAALLRHADEQTVNLTQKHIRGRLAEGLIHLKDHYGADAATGMLNIQLSREDLASLSNMTTSNAIRTLSAFANERLIAIEGRRITILQEEKLRNISRLG